MNSMRLPTTLLLLIQVAAHAEDWPEWRGKGRTGVWNETGVYETFPAAGLKAEWRTPLRAGYAGPAVSNGRIYVTDFAPASQTDKRKGTERVVCLDEKTGRVIWTHEWESDYTGLMGTYAIGPRATPTVDGNRVYALGAKGALVALDAATGKPVWKKDFVVDYKTNVPTWGMTGAPLVDGDRLIALVGGENGAKVVAFDKSTGKEIWRALPSDSEPGYCPPFMIEAGGVKQLIVFHPTAVASLNPVTGKVYWEQPYKAHAGMTIATPVRSGLRLLVTSFYNGSMMMELDPAEPAAKTLWKGKSASEIDTDGLHTVINTPVIDGDYIYGICSYGQLRCLNAKTGERVWETLDLTQEKARWSSGFIVRHGDHYYINNDRGDLIIAKLSPQGYHEISRTKLLKATSAVGVRREFGAVQWSHPAYANRHIVARNDEEIIRVSLEKR